MSTPLAIAVIFAIFAWLTIMLEVIDEHGIHLDLRSISNCYCNDCAISCHLRRNEKDKPMISKHNPPISKQTGVPGWHTNAEADLLIQLARKVPDGGVIVELGGEWGRSASEFLFATMDKDNVRVFTVDLFPDNYQGLGMNLMDILQENLNRWQQTAPYFVDLNLHRCVRGDSTKFLRAELYDPERDDFEDLWNGLSLLFVDATHTYEAVSAEIEYWTAYIESGGYVAFHDYAGVTNRNPHPSHYEVARAVDEWYEANNDEWEMVNEVDSTVVFKRKPFKAAEKLIERDWKPQKTEDGVIYIPPADGDKDLLAAYDAYDTPTEYVSHIEKDENGDKKGSVTVTKPATETAPPVRYEDMTRDELAEIAGERGLFVGNSKKTTLIKKLMGDDKK